MSPSDIQSNFGNLGGKFRTSAEDVSSTLRGIKGYIFDWDGVFNNGFKPNDNGSPFSEVDAMGINMLRFSHWLKHGELPKCYIITGANNQTALQFAKREHFNGVFLSYKDKKKALDELSSADGIQAYELGFLFDDILDLGLAEVCGLRLCVGRPGSPLMDEFVNQKQLFDYRTGNSGNTHAVREICELLIGLNGNYVQTIEERIKFSDQYLQYLNLRNSTEVRTHSA